MAAEMTAVNCHHCHRCLCRARDRKQLAPRMFRKAKRSNCEEIGLNVAELSEKSCIFATQININIHLNIGDLRRHPHCHHQPD